MKEAIGGSWLYTLVIVLITLFTTFVSVTTNYTRTYRVKDKLIQIIETHGGVTTDSLTEINNLLSSLGYTSTGNCPDSSESNEPWFAFSRTSTDVQSGYGTTGKANYCIYKHVVACRVDVPDSEGTSTTYINGQTGYNTFPRAYYGVATFFRLDWPILREVIKVEMTGETAIMYMTATNYELDAFDELNYCKKNP